MHASRHRCLSRLANLVYPAALALAAAGFAAESPKASFGNHCAACHGEDGRARTPAGRKLGARDLSESKLGHAEIEKLIREGTKDARGAIKMPAFQDKLPPTEISALAAYVTTFRSR